MNVTPLTSRIGVEVSGLDLRGGLSESQQRALNFRLVRGPCA